ncbi:MAG: hypothetical protein ACK55I_25880, partial [bacterium]
AGEVAHRAAERREVAGLLLLHVRSAGVEVDAAEVRVVVGAGEAVRRGLEGIGAHRPDEGVDRADDQDRLLAVPARAGEQLLAEPGGRIAERPGGVRAEPAGDAEAVEDLLRLDVAGDDERALHVARHHRLQALVHRPGLAAVAHRELVLGEREAQRADHHRGQRAGELALEH